MSRMTFGGGPEDVYLIPDAEGDLRPGGGYPALFYTAESGGAQITDLLNEMLQPVTYVTTADGNGTRAAGQIPTFYGPDNVFEMWCSVNSSPRFVLQASNLGSFAGPLLNQLIQHLSGGVNPHQTTLASLGDVDDVSLGAATTGQALVKGAGGLWIAGNAVGGGGGSGDVTLAGAQTFTGTKTFTPVQNFNGGTVTKPATAAGVAAIAQALSGQSANLHEWRDTGGSPRAWVSKDFGVYAPNSGRVVTFAKAGAVANGTGTFRFYNDTGVNLVIRSVRVTLGTAGSTTTTVDVNINGTTIFTTQSNRPSLGNGVVTSGKNTSAQVTNLANGEYLTADIDTSGTGASDLVVQIELW